MRERLDRASVRNAISRRASALAAMAACMAAAVALHCLGSTVALSLAANRPFTGVILLSPFTSGRDMALLLAKPFSGGRFDSLAALTGPAAFFRLTT